MSRTHNTTMLKPAILASSLILIVFLFLSISSDSFTFSRSTVAYSSREKDYLKRWGTIETAKGAISFEQAEEEIFKPMGYRIAEGALVPALDYLEPPSCPGVFEEWLAGSASQNESGTPPREIPENLLDQYTFNGYSFLKKGYMDDRSGTHYAEWKKETVDEYANKKIEEFVNYDGEGRAVYHAMKNYYIKGQSGIILGSLSPWVEGFALKLGASKITTVEYTKINMPKEYPQLSYAHPLDIARNLEKHLGAYDFATSFSSLEHSGLGRFGDALDPIGDLKESIKTHCLLKEGGLLFLGLPVGRDTLYWNLHRIYGQLRLAMMSAGFDLIDAFYMDSRVIITPQFFKKESQPVVVLRKRSFNSSK